MDAQMIERGQQWLEHLLLLVGTPAKVTANPNSELAQESCLLTIEDAQLSEGQVASLLGPQGSVLDSVQYLANSILNMGQDSGHQGAFTIDLSGYRQERYEALKAIAEEAVVQARETGKSVELKGLSSAERRQMHTFFKAYDDLETFSRGQEPDRRMVVRLLDMDEETEE